MKLPTNEESVCYKEMSSLKQRNVTTTSPPPPMLQNACDEAYSKAERHGTAFCVLGDCTRSMEDASSALADYSKIRLRSYPVKYNKNTG